MDVLTADSWFLGAEERGNASSQIDRAAATAGLDCGKRSHPAGPRGRLFRPAAH